MEYTNPIVLSLLISLGIQTFFFIFAASFKTDKVTDLSYGLSFVAIAWVMLLTRSGDISLHEAAVVTLVTLWGIRLSGYLLIRVLKTGRDKRYDTMRNDLLKFGRFWLLQGLSVWAISLPAVYMLSRGRDYEVSLFIVIGVLVWLFGIAFETVADVQLYNFRFKKDNKGLWIDEGVWRYSRHPNYFGEITLWWGLFICGLDVYSGVGWLAVAGPLTITGLLLFGSGIPILEKANDARWGTDRAYQQYKQETSILIPLPRQKRG